MDYGYLPSDNDADRNPSCRALWLACLHAARRACARTVRGPRERKLEHKRVRYRSPSIGGPSDRERSTSPAQRRGTVHLASAF